MLFSPAARSNRRNRERRATVADEVSKESRRLVGARVRRDQVHIWRRLVEGFTRGVDPFGLSLHLHPQASLEHVSNDRARMSMRGIGAARLIGDFHDGRFEVLAVEWRQ